MVALARESSNGFATVERTLQALAGGARARGAEDGSSGASAFTAANDPAPWLAPNQVDLGVTVVNLAISSIVTTNTPDKFGPFYELYLSFSTTDPATQSQVTSSPSAGEGSGCSSVASCGDFPFAFASVSTASLTLTLKDDQGGYLGCLGSGGYCGVNINGGSSSLTLSFPGADLGPDSQCVAPSGCTTSSVGSGSRSATVTYTLVVETALLSQMAGQSTAYSGFDTYLTQGLDGGSTYYDVLCPGVAATLLQPFTSQEIDAIIEGVFTILVSALPVTDVVSAFVAAILEIVGHLAIETAVTAWGDEISSTYPQEVSEIQGLDSIADQLSAVGCADVYNYWTFASYDPGMGPAIQNVGTDLSNLMTAVSGVQSALIAGGLSSSLSALGVEENSNTQLQAALSTLVNDLEDEVPSGCILIGVSCSTVGDWLAYNVFEPFLQLITTDLSELQSDVSTLSALLPLSVVNCGASQYVAEGVYYAASGDPLTFGLTGGIGPFALGHSGLPSWASLVQTSPGGYAIVGQAPATPGTSTVSLTGYDNVADTASCGSMPLVVTPGITFVESGLPAGTSWSVTLNQVTQTSTGPSITFAEPSGTYGYMVSAAGGSSPTPSSGSVTMSGSAVSVAVSYVSVAVLNGMAAEVWSYPSTYTLSFTVPSTDTHELFFWDITDTLAPTITTPSGLAPVASTEMDTSTGIAFGALAPGSYSVSIAPNGGWVNTISMAVYGISNDYQDSYQFGSAVQAKSLTLPAGASTYLGVLMTGGMPITSWSLTTINEEAASDVGGYTGLIGQQSSNTLSMATAAAGYGIAGVAILPPTVLLLSGYAAEVWSYPSTYTLSFTVPSGVSEELFVWDITDTLAPTITTPSGLSPVASTEMDTSTGIAAGALAPGSYSVSIAPNGDWVNTISMAVYGVPGGYQDTYQFGSAVQAKSLSLAAGGSDYVGVLMTGGMPITSWSLTTINEEAASDVGGYTGLIGQQSSNTLSMATAAAGYGIAAVGVYP